MATLWVAFAVAFLGCLSITAGQEDPAVDYLGSERAVLTFPMSCTFSRSFCGWTSAGSGFTLVSQLQGAVRPMSVSFAAADASASTQTDYILRGPTVAMSTPTQLSFKYIVFNAPMYDPMIEAPPHFGLYAVYSLGRETKLWELNRNTVVGQGVWLDARINLCLTGRFQLEVRVSDKRTDLFGSRISVGLAEFVINNEQTVFAGTSNANCLPRPVSQQAITCQIDTPSEVVRFCGWDAIADGGWSIPRWSPITRALGDPLSGSPTVFFQLTTPVPPPTGTTAYIVNIESSTIATASMPPGVLTFWYQKQDCRAELFVVENGAVTPALVLDGVTQTPTTETSEWVFASYRYTAGQQAQNLKFNVRVTFATPNMPRAFFSLNRVWYSTEQGYRADVLDPTREPTLSTTTTISPWNPVGTTTTARSPTSGAQRNHGAAIVAMLGVFLFFFVYAAL